MTACTGKIGGTVVTSLLMRVPVREALTLGLLANTKGLVELIMLNISRDRKVLNEEAFAILVLMALINDFMTSPAVTAVYRPARRVVVRAPDRRRTAQNGSRGIPTLINLVEASRGTRQSKLTMYAMHLVELSERSSAISMVQRARRNGLPFYNRRDGGGGCGVRGVPAAERRHGAADDGHLRPEHHPRGHRGVGAAEARGHRRAAVPQDAVPRRHAAAGGHRAYHHVNVRVLRAAPCSVAILVDRALGGASQVSAPDVSYAVLVLFFGGPDDREALAYAARMAEHPGIDLTVARLTAAAARPSADELARDEKALQEYVPAVRKSGDDDGSVRYKEEATATDRADVASAIKTLGRGKNVVVAGGRRR